MYVPFIYVDSDAAMASGREVGGYPKKIANIGMEQFGDEWRRRMERILGAGGKRILSISSRRGRKVFESDSDPIYRLPVMRVLGSMHAHGGLSVYWADIHILEELRPGAREPRAPKSAA